MLTGANKPDTAFWNFSNASNRSWSAFWSATVNGAPPASTQCVAGSVGSPLIEATGWPSTYTVTVAVTELFTVLSVKWPTVRIVWLF